MKIRNQNFPHAHGIQHLHCDPFRAYAFIFSCLLYHSGLHKTILTQAITVLWIYPSTPPSYSLRILFFPHKTNGLQLLLLVPSVFETPTQTSHIQAICAQRRAEHRAVPESFLLETLLSPLFLFDLKCTFQAPARPRLTSFTIHKERLESDCMTTYVSPFRTAASFGLLTFSAAIYCEV